MNVPQQVESDDLADPATRHEYVPGGSTVSVREVLFHGGLYVFKEYNQRERDQLDSHALAALVAWRRGLDPADQLWLDARAAFPLAVVTRQRAPVGVLMRRAPDRFFCDVEGARVPRSAGLVCLPQSDTDDMGHRYTEPPHALGYVGSLVRELHRLHRLGVVFGDVQPENVLVDFDGWSTDVFLLDCDSVTFAGVRALPHEADPELWKRPGRSGFDQRSDIYKAMLMAARALLKDLTVLPPFKEGVFTRFMSTPDAHVLCEVLRDGHHFDIPGAERLARFWEECVSPDGTLLCSIDADQPGGGIAVVEWLATTDSGTMSVDQAPVRPLSVPATPKTSKQPGPPKPDPKPGPSPRPGSSSPVRSRSGPRRRPAIVGGAVIILAALAAMLVLLANDTVALPWASRPTTAPTALSAGDCLAVYPSTLLQGGLPGWKDDSTALPTGWDATVPCGSPSHRTTIVQAVEGSDPHDCDYDDGCWTFSQGGKTYRANAVPHVGDCLLGARNLSWPDSGSYPFMASIGYPTDCSTPMPEFDPAVYDDRLGVGQDAIQPIRLRITDIADEEPQCYPRWGPHRFSADDSGTYLCTEIVE